MLKESIGNEVGIIIWSKIFQRGETFVETLITAGSFIGYWNSVELWLSCGNKRTKTH